MRSNSEGRKNTHDVSFHLYISVPHANTCVYIVVLNVEEVAQVMGENSEDSVLILRMKRRSNSWIFTGC